MFIKLNFVRSLEQFGRTQNAKSLFVQGYNDTTMADTLFLLQNYNVRIYLSNIPKIQSTIHDFSVWLKTGCAPPDIYRFRSLQEIFIYSIKVILCMVIPVVVRYIYNQVLKM